ncbi:hypothetical protein ACFX1R_021142 [Malus domestica]
MQRMGIGMLITVITMITAALVKTKRLQISRKMKMLGTQTDQRVPLSIFWLLPQYILLGLADIFTVVGMQEFFNSRVPTEGRSLASGMYTSVFGVGSYLSAILITAVENITSSKGGRCWFSDDLSEARLDNLFGSKLELWAQERGWPKRMPKGRVGLSLAKTQKAEKGFSDLVQLMKTTCSPTQRPSGID